MLILTCRVHEAICIGHDMKVVVTGVQGNRVMVGIQAPRNIEVDRLEVWERKQRERAAAELGGK